MKFNFTSVILWGRVAGDKNEGGALFCEQQQQCVVYVYLCKGILCATNNNFPFQKHEQQVWGVQKSQTAMLTSVPLD